MSARVPAEVFPLAQYLGEEMEERGWTSEDVALRMPWKTAEDFGKNAFVVDLLLAVQEDSLLISSDLYRDLERAFGVSEGFFERLNEPWQRYPDRRVPYEAPEFLFSGAMRKRAE